MVKKFLLSLLALAVALIAGVIITAYYLGNRDFGEWHAMPGTPAPSISTVYDPRLAAIDAALRELLVEHRARHHFPSMTAAIAIDGQLAWTAATGWAQLAPPVAASENTIYRVGSTSKAITATLLARIIDRGEMALDQPVGEYASWPNAAWNKLTPRQLGSHTAGLPGYEENGDIAGLVQTLSGRRNYTTVRDSLEIVDGSELLFEPGTNFAYSSFDTNILGAAISANQQRPYLQALREHVLNPLELDATHGAGQRPGDAHIASFYDVKVSAAPSDELPTKAHARTWQPFDLSQRWPGGGLLSTSAELAQIGASWMNDEFILPATRQAFWTPQRLSDGTVNEQRYAIGFRFYGDQPWPRDAATSLSYAHHGGVSKGAMSWLVIYPDYRLSVAVNINTRADTFSTFAAVEKELTNAVIKALR